MAVAVKNAPEVGSTSPLDRVPVVSLIGTVYLIACLGVVFELIPWLWGRPTTPGSALSLTVVMAAAVAGLAYLGARLLGPQPAKGVRAGIFTGFVGVLVVLFLTRWVSTWFEWGVYDHGWFGASGPVVGATLTAVIGALLLLYFVRWFLRPAREKTLVNFENQGWFSATSYKGLQGQRVRRGTIVGLLILLGAGIYTMISHGTLNRGPENWALNVPFTGKAVVNLKSPESRDFADLYRAEHPGADGTVEIDRGEFKKINDHLNPEEYVRVHTPDNPLRYGPDMANGMIVSRKEFEERVSDLKNFDALQVNDPQKADKLRALGLVPLSSDYDEKKDYQKPTPAKADLQYATLTLLPAVRYSLPLLLAALSLWFAWRIVNLPAFADFLIATEAELNKVSWPTRKRLYQDTIVVLVTVLLMAVYLFFMDQVWRILLTALKVLQFSEDAAGGTGGTELW